MRAVDNYQLRSAGTVIARGPLALMMGQALQLIDQDRPAVIVDQFGNAGIVTRTGDHPNVRWDEPLELFPRTLGDPPWLARAQRLLDQLAT